MSGGALLLLMLPHVFFLYGAVYDAASYPRGLRDVWTGTLLLISLVAASQFMVWMATAVDPNYGIPGAVSVLLPHGLIVRSWWRTQRKFGWPLAVVIGVVLCGQLLPWWLR